MSGAYLLQVMVDHGVALLGWSGALIVLVGYALMVSGRLPATGARYLTANLTGSLGLAVCAVQTHAWQSATVNVLWLAFGVGPLVRAVHRRTARRGA